MLLAPSQSFPSAFKKNITLYFKDIKISIIWISPPKCSASWNSKDKNQTKKKDVLLVYFGESPEKLTLWNTKRVIIPLKNVFRVEGGDQNRRKEKANKRRDASSHPAAVGVRPRLCCVTDRTFLCWEQKETPSCPSPAVRLWLPLKECLHKRKRGPSSQRVVPDVQAMSARFH